MDGEAWAGGRAGRPTLSAAIGARVATLRQRYQLTQDDVARAAQRLGFTWGASSVAELEAGRRNLGADELLGLPAIVTEAVERSVSAGGRDFVFNVGHLFERLLTGVRLTDQLELPREALLRVVGTPAVRDTAPADAEAVNDAPGVAERKAARRLGVPVDDVMAASVELWGRTLTAERNARLDEVADARSLQAQRGHVTRELLAELNLALGR